MPIYKLFNEIYECEKYHKNGLSQYSRKNTTKNEEHSIISLIFKDILKTIHARIYRKIYQDNTETQLVFRNRWVTREAFVQHKF